MRGKINKENYEKELAQMMKKQKNIDRVKKIEDENIKRQLNINEKSLRRKTKKELIIIAEDMKLSITVSRAQYKYYDNVPASKSLLIERIIKKIEEEKKIIKGTRIHFDGRFESEIAWDDNETIPINPCYGTVTDVFKIDGIAKCTVEFDDNDEVKFSYFPISEIQADFKEGKLYKKMVTLKVYNKWLKNFKGGF